MMQTNFSIRAYSLMLAALEFAPKDHTKYYLNAVHIAPYADGAHVVATDGCALFIGRATVTAADPVSKGGVQLPFVPLTIERNSLAAALKAVKKAVKTADTVRIELDDNDVCKTGRLVVFNCGEDPTEKSAITAPLEFFNDPASAPYPNYLRAIPRYIQPGNPAPLIDCKYLTAVCKAAAALRPAKEKAAVRAEANGNMQAVYALADDAAVVMSIHAPDCSRYEQTITGILDAE